MWILVSTKYTVVDRNAASLSNAVPGLTKCVTSAICTPTSRLPFGRSLQWSASSISVQPGGSTEHTSKYLRSSLCAMSYKRYIQFIWALKGLLSSCILLHTTSVTLHEISGNELRTASENRLWGISCSNNITSFSVVLFPISPNARTKWPRGYLELRGHESIATMILCLHSTVYCLVSILILGIFRSAGTNKCRTF